MKYGHIRLFAMVLILFLSGCSVAQVRQEFVGFSIEDVRSAKQKQAEIFDMSASECLTKIKDAIGKMHAGITWDDKGKQYIVAYGFQSAFRSTIDTTQVGILVTSLGENKSQVEVASGNVDLAIFVSKELSKRLKPISEKPAEK